MYIKMLKVISGKMRFGGIVFSIFIISQDVEKNCILILYQDKEVWLKFFFQVVNHFTGLKIRKLKNDVQWKGSLFCLFFILIPFPSICLPWVVIITSLLLVLQRYFMHFHIKMDLHFPLLKCICSFLPLLFPLDRQCIIEIFSYQYT